MKDNKGMTPLFYAASIGYLKGVESLLRKTTKCSVYEGNAGGYCPIHIASWEGHIKVVEKLLHDYPDMIELRTDDDLGYYPIHIASWKGHIKLVEKFLHDYLEMI